ncbi:MULTISPECIES: carbohydrate porin [Ramlibacter]|nr:MULTISPECIES: carbohydrate porin [Ramlibacter]
MKKPLALALAALAGLQAVAALAADDGSPAPADEAGALHLQFTNVTQKHPPLRSPYAGPNSLKASERAEETSDITLYAGWRPWRGASLWINPEIDQGFGLSNTVGLAGFSSGEAYKVGANRPYLRLPRVFLRQVFALGDETEAVDARANQLAGLRPKDNITLTVGKFSVVDVFDNNAYAHDPRADFMNWSIVDAGAFDYAADPWGYTHGAALEWTQGDWTWRGGVFQMSRLPNNKVTGLHFGQFMAVTELERRYEWNGQPGTWRVLAFGNRARMADYEDAVAQGAATASTPDVAGVRKLQWRSGFALNLEQALAADLGVFARFSRNDGRREAYEFSEINRSESAGVALKGGRWGRATDTLGLALAQNHLSAQARDYFAAGGMGILIGDGALRYGPERIVEGYYAVALARQLTLTADLQRVLNPAYNRDRGPVTVYGLRVHAEF